MTRFLLVGLRSPPGFAQVVLRSASSELCSVGWILRDEAGNGRWYGAKTYPSLISSLEAEAAALTWAVGRCPLLTTWVFERYNLKQTLRSCFRQLKIPHHGHGYIATPMTS
ncbi:unnamed protein product [Microthlaspi erraticum]|uniref:RNase H type-1 domain-containing protein n=1 Tax=Microthlaspi erraticum TaxID=1685480 RepID=A0A6D2IQJ8_9BRAS|nr:unnamed protein product [Microthlaspi erraticum]